MAPVAWSIIYLLLLLSLLTPLRIITSFLLIVPGVVLFSLLPFRLFLVHVIPVMVIIGIYNPLFLLAVVYFLIPAMVMGRAYKKSVSSFQTIMMGTGVILLEFLFLLLIGTAFFGFDLSQHILEIVTTILSPLQDVGSNDPLMSQLALTSADTETIATATIRMVPYALIISSFMMAVITHAIARPVLSALGMSVPKLKPAREWRLPRSLIWYYLIAIILNWVTYGSEGSWLKTIADNMVPLLHICFIIQTFGFIFFLSHTRKWNPVISGLLIVAVILVQPLRIVGIIDLAFPLREAITRSKR